MRALLDLAEGNGLRARAQGAALWGFISFFLLETGVCSRALRVPGDPPQPSTFPCSVHSSADRGLRPEWARLGSAGLRRGPREEPPPWLQRTPDTKAGAGSAGRARVSTPTFAPAGGGFVNIFRFQPLGRRRTTPHANRPLSKKPLKSGRGFCSRLRFCFFHFLRPRSPLSQPPPQLSAPPLPRVFLL